MSAPEIISKNFSSIFFADTSLPDDVQDVCLSLIDDKTIYDALHKIENPTSNLYKNGCLELAKRDLELLSNHFVDPVIFEDEKWVLTALKVGTTLISWSYDSLLKICKIYPQNKTVMVETLKHRGTLLEFAGHTLKNDKDVVLVAVLQNGKALEYAGPTLKNDKDVVLAALRHWNAGALEHASPDLKNDQKVVLAAVSNHGLSLQHASPDLKNNREIVLTAVQNCGNALEFASPELQNNKDIVLAAVKNRSEALQFASPELKNDREIVLLAVRNSHWAFQYASPDLQNDREIVSNIARRPPTRHLPVAP